ncbi:hypothetical protein ACFQZQ_10545 [Lysobacter koreensis]|uniref:Uncharacterized protein n=1 Tax=Lysobacter koreensis TaxID=266122 RepID=A0ABW2YMX0_9GAMM
MSDLILRDIEPGLLACVQRIADARGWSVQQVLVYLLERGLASSNAIDEALEGHEVRLLEDALAALEDVPSDPGFALIGRAPAVPAVPDAPDQSIAPSWASPGPREP